MKKTNTTKAFNRIIGGFGAKRIVRNFVCGEDWERDSAKLFSKLRDYYCNKVGVYNDNIETAIDATVCAVIIEHYPEKNFFVTPNLWLFEEEQND